MRILMACQFYPPDIGGEERHVRSLALALRARGHEVDVVTSSLREGDEGDRVEDGVPVRRVRTTAQRLPLLHSDSARPHHAPIADHAMSRAIAELLATRGYDVVHAHNWIVNSAIGPTRATGVPLVQTLHDYSHVCATKRYMYEGSECSGPGATKCLRCASRQYGAVVGVPTALANALSYRARNRAVATFVPVSRAVAERNRLGRGPSYRVIANFIPDELLVDSAEPRPDGPLLYVGDLSTDKGVAVLLEAYRRLEAPPAMQLVGRAVGDLPAAPPGATLLEPRPHPEVMEMMRTARAVVVPSLFPDPCPTVVLEAMAAGRPVVASATGGIVDMVEDGVSGRLVRPGEPEQLAAALAEVLAEPETAAAMGKAALAAVRSFTASAVVSQIEELYRQLCAPAGGKTPAPGVEASLRDGVDGAGNA